MYTREFLSALRTKAVRHHVLYRSLDQLDRGILYLSTRFVDKVTSIVLYNQLTEIVTKLTEALKSSFQRHLEEYGYDRLARIVLQALQFGSMVSFEWIEDKGFAEYLTMYNLNQPSGYR